MCLKLECVSKTSTPFLLVMGKVGRTYVGSGEIRWARVEGLYHFSPFLIHIFPFYVISTVLNKTIFYACVYCFVNTVLAQN